MRNIFTVLLLLCFVVECCHAQSVKKVFQVGPVNASINKQKTNLILENEEEREFERPDSLSQYDYRIYKNELKYHLTKIGEMDKQYWNKVPILLCYNKNKIFLSLDTDHDNSFKDEEVFMSTNLDSVFKVKFNFKHKHDLAKNISIPVNLKVLFADRSIRLHMQYDEFFQTDEIHLAGSENHISVFPFTGMARYEIKNIETKESALYFRNELIEINGIHWRIDSFDYPSKKILIDSVGVVERPKGFRVDQYVDKDLFKKGIENQSINKAPVDLEKDYTILHFWGDWCQPCLKELPRLRKLLLKLDNERINMIHINYLLEKSNRSEAIDFINSSNLQGVHLLDAAIESYSLVNLLNSISYPNYVILDSDFKIVYRSDESDINLPAFLKSIGLL